MPENINPIQLAWAAGVIEGEGSIQVVQGRKSKYDGRQLLSYQLRVVMADQDILERIRDVFGEGKVTPYRNTQGLGKKQLYRWDVRRADLVKAICIAIYPHMGIRRKAQIDHVLDTLAKNPLVSSSEKVKRKWETTRRRDAE